jgi:hypothetical protein
MHVTHKYVNLPLESLYVLKKPDQNPLHTFKGAYIGTDSEKRICFKYCYDYNYDCLISVFNRRGARRAKII